LVLLEVVVHNMWNCLFNSMIEAILPAFIMTLSFMLGFLIRGTDYFYKLEEKYNGVRNDKD